MKSAATSHSKVSRPCRRWVSIRPGYPWVHFIYNPSLFVVCSLIIMSDIPNDRIDESTPLLASSGESKQTPLPKHQIGIVLLLQICEPITSQSIYPYINAVSSFPSNLVLDLTRGFYPLKLISELDITGGDEKKVGYYAGLIVGHLSPIKFLFLHPRSGISIFRDRSTYCSAVE